MEEKDNGKQKLQACHSVAGIAVGGADERNGADGRRSAGGNNPQVAQPENGGVNWKGAGIGAAALLANVGYIPAKTAYAIMGGIAGGVGYALTGGNEKASNTIWRSYAGRRLCGDARHAQRAGPAPLYRSRGSRR